LVTRTTPVAGSAVNSPTKLGAVETLMLVVSVGGASGVIVTLSLSAMLVAGYTPSVGCGVFTGLAVGVLVAVRVGVFVGVSVAVLVAVLDGVNVGVWVAVFVEVGVGPATVKLPFVVTDGGSPSLNENPG
jgi:hypothetical protein